MFITQPTTRPLFRAFLPAVLFAAVVLAINGHWFRVPLIEGSDFAANSIQVYHAKMFREMLGNYSRWQFHHPGPVFFYVLAGGEYLFRDWLRIVPAPMNAQFLTLVLVNTAWLFGSIEIFARHFQGTLFRPLALAAAVLVIYNVNHPHSIGALVSLWMPHVALFAFLFFASACASVAAGRFAHLPLLALGPMTMVHLHVAQFLFAGVMSLCACAAALVGVVRAREGRRVFRQYAGAMAVSAGIVALFLLPMGLELVLHKPNNLDYVLAYLQEIPESESWAISLSPVLTQFSDFLQGRRHAGLRSRFRAAGASGIHSPCGRLLGHCRHRTVRGGGDGSAVAETCFAICVDRAGGVLHDFGALSVLGESYYRRYV